MNFLPDDWVAVFAPEAPVIELIVRGAALYLGVMLLMRFMPRRTGGEMATTDLILIVLIADSAAQGLGNYRSVADGLVVVLTLMGLNYLLNALSYRVRFVEWLTASPPLQVVRNGQLLRRNMRREFLTEDELMSHLREHGIDNLQDVKAAYIEGEGHLSVVPRKRQG